MMMKSVFWWRKPEYPEETTDPRQVTEETFHTYGLCPVRGLNLGRSGVKQSELRRDESGALAHRATAAPLPRFSILLLFPSIHVHACSLPGLRSCPRLIVTILRISFRASTLTMANSSKAANTNMRHVVIHMSMAFMYDTRGSDWRAPELCVVMVRMVRTPSEILAGMASMLIQKETQDRMTMRALGM